MEYCVFYLRDDCKTPLGIVLFDGREYHRVVWFFIDAERDVKSPMWEWADRLFSKVIDWIEESSKYFLPKADRKLRPSQKEFWQHVGGRLLPEKLGLTEPRPVSCLLELYQCTTPESTHSPERAPGTPRTPFALTFGM